MKILLINPPFQRLAKVYNTYFPLGMGYIASVLEKAGYYVRIYNADKGKEEDGFIRPTNRSSHIKAHENYINAINDKGHYVWREINETIRDFKPEVVGIQTMTSTFPSAKMIAKMVKEYDPSLKVIAGGVHATTVPDEVISDKCIDFVVYGEGEETAKELIEKIAEGKDDYGKVNGIYYKIKGEIKKTAPREFIKDLDALPFPGRHLVLHPELYTHEFGSLIMGRGCPFKCTFCGSKIMWTTKVRSRSPENVIREIEMIKDEYGIRSFSFQDDTLTFSKKRLLELCGLLIERRAKIHWSSYSRVDIISEEMLPILKKSGCYSLGFGVESGSKRMLKIMKKDIDLEEAVSARKLLKRYGIDFCSLFLIGTPDETVEDLKDTIKFVKILKPDSVNVCTFTPYPGTEMYKRAVELGVAAKDLDQVYFSHHSEKNMFSKFMTKEEFVKLRNELISIADSITNQLNTTRLRNMLRLLIRDPGYFIKRIPHYIGIIITRIEDNVHSLVKKDK